ncbi:MAG: proton-conducting transporter membrane subunit [candidate division Zixibacteria bacterium]|nr:proton-conducting transporter membrane subunit [candidate division Zixibacteria bacterium]
MNNIGSLFNAHFILPELLITVTCLMIALCGRFSKFRNSLWLGYSAIFSLLCAGIILWVFGYGQGYSDIIFNDPFAVFCKTVVLIGATLGLIPSVPSIAKRYGHRQGDYYALLLLMVLGTLLVCSANELVMIYLGLELIFIPLYIISAYFHTNDFAIASSSSCGRGRELLLTGVFSSALFAYGLSLLYGLSGTTNLVQAKINMAMTQVSFNGEFSPVLLAASLLIGAGLLIKLFLPLLSLAREEMFSSFPSELRSIYQTSIATAVLAGFIKIFMNTLFAFSDPVMAPNDWGTTLGLLAAVAILYSTVGLFSHRDLPTTIYHLWIIQIGICLAGTLSLSAAGMTSIGFTLIIQTLPFLGALAITGFLRQKQELGSSVTISGLYHDSPSATISLIIFLLAMIGVPPTAGFISRFDLLQEGFRIAASDGRFAWLYLLYAVIILSSFFGLLAVIRIIRSFFVKRPDFVSAPFQHRPSLALQCVMLVCASSLILFGVYPAPLVAFVANLPSVFGFPVK